MKLTKAQEQAVSAWYARYCIDNGKEPIKLLASNIAVAATERMQDEIDKLQGTVATYTLAVQDANNENAKLREAVEAINVAWKYPYNGDDPEWTDRVQKAIDDALSKAGLDQREAPEERH